MQKYLWNVTIMRIIMNTWYSNMFQVIKNCQDILENLCVHSKETKHYGRLKTHVYMTI